MPPANVLDILRMTKINDASLGCVYVIIFASFFIGVFLSVFWSLLILISFISGVFATAFLLKYEHKWPSIASYIQDEIVSSKKAAGEPRCTICNGPGCARHKPNLNHPWKAIYIEKELNTSLENFFDHILDEFVGTWYKEYTNDRSFICELKHSIRFGSASAVKRFLELDVGRIIVHRLFPCLIKHVDDYLCMAQIAELKHCDVNMVAVDYLGKRLHFAASNRSNELKYLQHLSTALNERLLPPESLKCKNFSILLREILAGWVLLPLMDVLADPNIINHLIALYAMHSSDSSTSSQQAAEYVEFLSAFARTEFQEVALAISLKDIIKDPVNLYHFMQYLKKEGSVHLLQFCLNIEDFNGNLLRPDLTKKQLEELHADALSLYRNYLDPKSDSFIGCSMEVVGELKALLDEGVYNVAKLQTAEPLYKASEFAFRSLEREWLPTFYHSQEFYNIIGGNKAAGNSIKGTATSPFISGSPIRMRQKRYNDSPSTVGKLSNSLGKIRGVLQSKQPVEGSIYPHESRILDNDAAFVDDLAESTNRNLSTWRIAIPAVETHPYGAKTLYNFNVTVQRTDAVSPDETRRWTVKRTDQDFYTLKAKLIEFHGGTEICNSPLPARKSTMSIDARKLKYEEFLKRLLEKPLLKGSDLLHTFLTSKQDFTLLVTTSLPIVDLENIYQSVASKLRKEKGQYLDGFLVTFFNSTGRRNMPKFEWAELGDEIDWKETFAAHARKPKTFQNRTFANNFGSTYKRDRCGSPSFVNPSGFTDSAYHLLKHIFHLPERWLKVYATICSLAHLAIEPISRWGCTRLLQRFLSQSTLAFLVGELDVLIGNIINGKHVPSTAEEQRAWKETAERFLSEQVAWKCTRPGLLKLFKILQNANYNKQLAYNLVDIVLAEMYPELDAIDEFY